MSTDALSELQPISFREIGFPCSGLVTEFTSDLPRNKRVGVDGAAVESTGRNEISVACNAHFQNLIFPGKSESWVAGSLYPGEWRRFIAACADTSEGTLVHPSLGPMLVRCASFKSTLSATARGGEDVAVTFITSQPEDGSIITAPAAAPAALLAAINLDKSAAQAQLELKLKVPILPDGPSMEDSLRSIQGAIDKSALAVHQVTASIDRLQGKLDSMKDSIERLRSASTAAVRTNVERLQSALHDVRRTVSVGRETIAYIVPRETTIALLAQTLGSKVSDLMTLNPDIIRDPVIPERTLVRHYR